MEDGENLISDDDLDHVNPSLDGRAIPNEQDDIVHDNQQAENSASSDSQPWDKAMDEDAEEIEDVSESMDTSNNKESNTLSIENTSSQIRGKEASLPLAQQYNLRPGRAHSYAHQLATSMNASSGTKSYNPHIQLLQMASNNMETCPGDMFFYIFGFMMMQMTASQGINKHRQKAVDVLFSEFCQLDNRVVFDPMDAKNLMHEQKRAALCAINLIKEIWSGTLKGHTCADGSLQCTMYTKEETASPTVVTNALMLSLMIDVIEG